MKRLSVNSAAKACGVSRRIIADAVKRGEIRCLRVKAGVFRILPTDLETWVRAKTMGRGV